MKQPIPFGKYLLLERINVGGMAEIFLARSRGVGGFQRILAIKKILPTMAEDQEFIAMFIDEARIAAELSHAGIVQIYELGKFEDDYYIAMEFIHGKDLRFIQERLARESKTMDVHLAAAVGFKICEALDYAHNKRDPTGKPLGIIHRDISPQNVIVSYDGEVKICDFGIAKAANRSQKTQAGVLKGKFGYMSPEQVRGLPLDGRSDIFTVGTLLYEMITMQRLFLGESDFSTLEKVRNADVVPPSTYNRDIPEDLEDIVLHALAKEVEDRQQGAAEMADALQLFLMENRLAGSRELAEFMQETFPAEFEAELRRLEEYQEMPEPVLTGGFERAPQDPEEDDDADADPNAKTMIFATSEPPAVRTTPPPIPPKKNAEGDAQASGQPAPSAAALADAKTAIFSEPAVGQLADAKTMIFADPDAQPAGDIHELPTRLPGSAPPPRAVPDTDPSLATPAHRSRAERLFYPLALLTALLLGYSIYATYRLRQAAPVAGGAASLELVTVPSAELMLLVDGEAVGQQTPYRTQALTPGEHRLRVSRAGYKAIERTFVLIAGQRLVMHLVLAPDALAAELAAANGGEDAGAGSAAGADGGPEIEAAGMDGGLAAGADGGDDGGAALVAVGGDGDAGQASMTADGRAADADRAVEVAIKPPPALADLVVNSEPQGATLLLNGRKVGLTPYRAKLKPDAGTRLYLRLKGHFSVSKTVNLIAGEKTEVSVSLAKRTVVRPPKPTPKEYGFLLANTRPWSKVFVDGRNTGRETPIAPDKKLRLTAGPHTITFEIPGGKRFDFKVEIKTDETLKLIKRLE